MFRIYKKNLIVFSLILLVQLLTILVSPVTTYASSESNVIELGSINTNGQNYATTSRARTIQSYKADEQSFTVDTSKAEGSRYAVIGFDSNGSRILDTGWRTSTTYDLPSSVVTYRLLFSYSDNRTLTNADLLLFDSELTITDKSSVIELGSINTNGQNYATTSRARTIQSYKADEQSFTVDTSKAEGSRYAVIGFDSDGSRILDTGWRTSTTYDLPSSVVTYRLLFSYSDNRTLTNADLLLFDSELTITDKSSVIELGSINTNGQNYATTSRARTIQSYKADEQSFTVDTSKAEGSRYAVIGFDSNGSRILDTGWRTSTTYDLPSSVVTYRLLFSYSDNRTLTNADLLLFDSELTITDKSSVIELGSINTNGQNYATTSRARTIQSYKADEQSFTVDTSKAEGSRYAVVGFDSTGARILDTGWRTSTTYDIPSKVDTYRLLFSYTDNRTLTNADLLLFDSELTITEKSSVIELGSINTNGQNYATTSRARTIQSYKISEQNFTVDTSKAEGSRYAVIGFDSTGKRILDTGWRTSATYAIPSTVVTYRLLFSYSDNRTLTNADLLLFDSELTISDRSMPIITSHPQSASIMLDDSCTLSVTAEGSTTLTYTWYTSTDNGANWTKVADNDQATYTFSSTEAGSVLVYCVVNDIYGNSVTSDTATVTVTAYTISMKNPPLSVAQDATSATYTATSNGSADDITWSVVIDGVKSEQSGTGSTFNVKLSDTAESWTVTCTIHGVSSSVTTVREDDNETPIIHSEEEETSISEDAEETPINKYNCEESDLATE